MKLRNKKTGEIVKCNGFIEGSDFTIPLSETTLTKINEMFEEPCKAPLIKNEKIRKLVKAWAEVNYLTDVQFEDDGVSTFIGGDYERISFNPWRQSGLKDNKIYTINELCGSENENE